MAKQNFLSGGFYGKLGQIVGQRWKNKRTMRVYVVPHDPKTPLQLEQRSKFGTAVIYAQSAMLSNYNCSFFISDDITQWQMRMSEARNNMKSSNNFLTILPLCPKDKVPPFLITDCYVYYDGVERKYKILIQCPNLEEIKKCIVYATNNPTTTDKNDIYVFTAINTESDPNIYTIEEVGDFQFNENTHIRIVSIDDIDALTEMVMSPEMVSNPDMVLTKPFNTNVEEIYITDNEIRITFAQVASSNRASIERGNIFVKVNGNLQLHNFPYSAFYSDANKGGKMVYVLENDLGRYGSDWEFAPANPIPIVNITAYSNTGVIRYNAQNVYAQINNVVTPKYFNTRAKSFTVGAECVIVTFMQKAVNNVLPGLSHNITINVIDSQSRVLKQVIDESSLIAEWGIDGEGYLYAIFEGSYSTIEEIWNINTFTCSNIDYRVNGERYIPDSTSQSNVTLTQYGKLWEGQLDAESIQDEQVDTELHLTATVLTPNYAGLVTDFSSYDEGEAIAYVRSSSGKRTLNSIYTLLEISSTKVTVYAEFDNEEEWTWEDESGDFEYSMEPTAGRAKILNRYPLNIVEISMYN